MTAALALSGRRRGCDALAVRASIENNLGLPQGLARGSAAG